MIDFYALTSPNVQKIYIMLEECGLPYKEHFVDVWKGDQFNADFVKLNPNGKIPVIVDREGPGGKPFKLFESGAILMYLAEKSGKLWPADMAQRYNVIQWLMFQMGGVGPMFGQANYFYRLEEKVTYAVERFYKEALRLYNVLNKQLGESEFLAGAYSIADIATYPWVWRHDGHHVKLEEFPNVKRWYEQISQRAEVQRGMEIPKR